MKAFDEVDFGSPFVVDAGDPIVCRFWDGPSDLLLVCAHGVMASSVQWAPVAGQLRRWGRVVAVDLPGFGHSPLAGRSGVAGMRDALAAVVGEFAVGGRTVVMATSMGAAVAVSFAGTYPHQIDGLVIGSGYLPSYFGGWRAPAVLAALLAEQVGNAGRGVRTSLLLGAMGRPTPEQQLASADSFVAPAGVDRPSPAQRRWAAASVLVRLAAVAAIPALSRRMYDRVKAPTLLLHGVEDPLVPVPWAYRVADRSGWDIHALPAVAHVVKLGSPEWWLGEVGTWLVRHGLMNQARLSQ